MIPRCWLVLISCRGALDLPFMWLERGHRLLGESSLWYILQGYTINPFIRPTDARTTYPRRTRRMEYQRYAASIIIIWYKGEWIFRYLKIRFAFDSWGDDFILNRFSIQNDWRSILDWVHVGADFKINSGPLCIKKGTVKKYGMKAE